MDADKPGIPAFQHRLLIVRSDQHIAWRGDVGQLSVGGKVESDGQRFNTLEALFLHLVGEQHKELEWL